MNIFKFTIDNNNFEINYENDELVCLKNKEKVGNEEEQEIINQVLKKITTFENIVTLPNVNYHGKVYLHQFAKSNHFHIFYEIRDSKYYWPDKEAMAFFNLIYNDEPEFVTMESEENRPKKRYYKRKVKIGSNVIMVLVTVGAILVSPYLVNYGIEALPHESDISTSISTSASVSASSNFDESSEEIKLEEIKKAINENPNLTNQEKQVLLNNDLYFLDNLADFDNEIMDRIRTLQVVYTRDKSDYDYNGIYEANKNVCTIYNANELTSDNQSIFTHEVLHSFTHCENYSSYGRAFWESLNTLFNNEYFGRNDPTQIYDMSYSWDTRFLKLLCEILEPSDIRELHASCNSSLLEEKLQNLGATSEEAIDFITSFDAYNAIFMSVDDWPDDTLDFLEENENKILGYLKKFYESAKNDKIENNDVFMYWYNQDLFLENLSKQLFTDSKKQQLATYNTMMIQDKYYLNSTYVDLPMKFSVASDYDVYGSVVPVQELIDAGAVALQNNELVIVDDLWIGKNEEGQFVAYDYNPKDFVTYEVSTVAKGLSR